MSDHQLLTGDDGETQFLVTIWDDGEIDLATRPLAGGNRVTWSPPARLEPQPVEVPC